VKSSESHNIMLFKPHSNNAGLFETQI